MRLALALAGVALAMLAAAGQASATVTVRLLGSDLRVEGDGLADNLRLSLDLSVIPPRYRLDSTQQIVRGDTFCQTPTTTTSGFAIICPSNTPTGVAVVLSGGNDSWIDNRSNSPAAPVVPDPVAVNGGIGNDSMLGTAMTRETFTGGDGDDNVGADGGGDTISGGPGNDSLDDEDWRHPDLPNAASDTLTGGLGDDTLGISEGSDTAEAEDGNDRIVERDNLPFSGQVPFGDTVSGGTGTDTFTLVRDRPVTLRDDGTSAVLFSDEIQEEVVRGMEVFQGGRGGDVINGALASLTAGFRPTYAGREGPDVVIGGGRADFISGGNGADRIFGMSGADEIDAKAGEPAAAPDELIDCGETLGDKASIDLLDPDPIGCETVDRSAIREGPHVAIGALRRVRRRPRVRAVRLRCPRRLGHRCRGRLELALTRRGLDRAPSKRYSIRAGRRRTVRVRLSRRDTRRLRRRRVRRAFVRSTERGDVAGKKTTLALRRLRRR